MKNQNHSLSIFFGVLAGVLIFGNRLGLNGPIINNDRTSLITIGFLGMALCSQGIGRIAEDRRWTHPVSLLGIMIGTVTLVLWVGRLLYFELPYAQTDSQTILTMGVLMGSKFLLARLYAFFRPTPEANNAGINESFSG